MKAVVEKMFYLLVNNCEQELYIIIIIINNY
jgi:hypothetical protein